MTGYSLGEQLTNAHGRIVDLETELRCTEGDLAVAVAEAQRVRGDLATVIATKGGDWQDGYDTGCDMSHSLGCGSVQDERDFLRRELECAQTALTEARVDVGAERAAAGAILRRAREFVESAWGRAEQAAEQVNRIPAAGVAQAFADLADILGSDE